jgi:hypothetical protein
VAIERREGVEAEGWRQRRRELPGVLEREANCRDALARDIARAERNGSLTDTATRENAVAGQVLAERRELAVMAASIAPPAYITKELGERPSDPAKRQAWDRGVAQIERYRQEYCVRDPNKAFGRDGKREAERAPQEAARRRLQEAQRALGLGQHAARARQLARGLGIGR